MSSAQISEPLLLLFSYYYLVLSDFSFRLPRSVPWYYTFQLISSIFFFSFFCYKSKYAYHFSPAFWKLLFLKGNIKIAICVHGKNSPYDFKKTKFKMTRSVRFKETGWCFCSKFGLVSPFFSPKRGKKSHSE